MVAILVAAGGRLSSFRPGSLKIFVKLSLHPSGGATRKWGQAPRRAFLRQVFVPGVLGASPHFLGGFVSIRGRAARLR